MRRRDFVRQKDSMQCGVASLAMVCRILGQKYSIEFLTKFCHTTTEGVSMMGLRHASTRLGLETVAAKISLHKLNACPLPAILHWNQNHFVVLHRISDHGKRYHIADPGKGMITLNSDEFQTHWISTSSHGDEKGIAMLFSPTEDFGNVTEQPDPCKRSFRFLVGYLKQYHRYFLQIIIGLLFGCLLQLILPLLTQSVVDIGIRYKDISFIRLILLGELMIIVGRTATDFIRRWLLLHISMRINISLVSDFFIKLLRLPMSFFDTKLSGDLLQRMEDHSRVQTFLTGQLLSAVFAILSFVVFGIVLLVYDSLIFSVFLGGTMIYTVWTVSFLHRRKVIDYEMFEQNAVNQNKTWQFITSMQEIKLQDCEQRRRWEWEDTQADLFTIQMKSLRLTQTQEAGGIFLSEVRNILITIFSAGAVISGNLSLGAMLAIQYIVGQLSSPVSQLISFIYSLQDVRISLERINEIHRGKDEEPEEGRLCTYPSGALDLTLNSVWFRYDLHSPIYTLSNITLTIPTGKVTAIVGASGSGKSTLIKLLLGYYHIEEGRITIGKNQLKEYSMRWWRRRCGVVMQDGVIFSESIARNIATDDSPVNRERLEQAARTACIHDYIMTLPLGYDTIVGKDGRGLSQGQKQRLLIARAVYRDPDFLFLDEATNSLDADNERQIVENLEHFFKGRTVVIVAHRLSTVRNADRIVVLEGGKVVEIGNHDILTANRGRYFTLVKNQLELGT